MPVAIFFLWHGFRAEEAERYRLAAENQRETARLDMQIESLDSALFYGPDNPKLHEALADACHVRAEEHGEHFIDKSPDLQRAFEHYQRARQLCPLLVKPNIFCSEYIASLLHHDSVEQYLDRVGFLDPSNPKSWYLIGLHAFQSGEKKRCWECWRHSLECAPPNYLKEILEHPLKEILEDPSNYLKKILEQSRPVLSTEDIVRDVLPNNPELLWDAYVLLEAQQQAGDGDRLYLQRALELLQTRPPSTGEEFLLQARIHLRLHEIDASVSSFRRALALQPSKLDWRFELSEVLFNDGRYPEALGELKKLTGLNPQNLHWKNRYEEVNRLVARDPTGERKVGDR